MFNRHILIDYFYTCICTYILSYRMQKVKEIVKKPCNNGSRMVSYKAQVDIFTHILCGLKYLWYFSYEGSGNI